MWVSNGYQYVSKFGQRMSDTRKETSKTSAIKAKVLAVLTALTNRVDTLGLEDVSLTLELTPKIGFSTQNQGITGFDCSPELD